MSFRWWGDEVVIGLAGGEGLPLDNVYRVTEHLALVTSISRVLILRVTYLFVMFSALIWFYLVVDLMVNRLWRTHPIKVGLVVGGLALLLFLTLLYPEFLEREQEQQARFWQRSFGNLMFINLLFFLHISVRFLKVKGALFGQLYLPHGVWWERLWLYAYYLMLHWLVLRLAWYILLYLHFFYIIYALFLMYYFSGICYGRVLGLEHNFTYSFFILLFSLKNFSTYRYHWLTGRFWVWDPLRILRGALAFFPRLTQVFNDIFVALRLSWGSEVDREVEVPLAAAVMVFFYALILLRLALVKFLLKGFWGRLVSLEFLAIFGVILRLVVVGLFYWLRPLLSAMEASALPVVEVAALTRIHYQSVLWNLNDYYRALSFRLMEEQSFKESPELLRGVMQEVGCYLPQRLRYLIICNKVANVTWSFGGVARPLTSREVLDLRFSVQQDLMVDLTAPQVVLTLIRSQARVVFTFQGEVADVLRELDYLFLRRAKLDYTTDGFILMARGYGWLDNGGFVGPLVRRLIPLRFSEDYHLQWTIDRGAVLGPDLALFYYAGLDEIVRPNQPKIWRLRNDFVNLNLTDLCYARVKLQERKLLGALLLNPDVQKK